MSTAIATVEFSAEQMDLIKQTICRGATNDELALFINQCKRTGLDPFTRQIHAVKRWDKTAGREVMTIQTGIDGYRLIADRTERYAGSDDAVYDREDDEHPGKATVTVWKLVAGQRVPFTRSARWDEYVQTTKEGQTTRFWKKMPYLMLAKCAEALALRAAFPQELSGLYTAEEMGQADSGVEATHKALPPKVVAVPAVDCPDQEHVREYERVAAECSNRDEVTTLVDAVKADAKLTSAGRDYVIGVLRERYKRVPAAKPVRQREPGDDDGELVGAGLAEGEIPY